jgi:hypothetical protein
LRIRILFNYLTNQTEKRKRKLQRKKEKEEKNGEDPG